MTTTSKTDNVNNKKTTIATVGIFAVAMIWGYSFVATKIMLTEINPFYIIALRKISGAMLLNLIFIKRMLKTSRSDIINTIPAAIALFSAYAMQTSSLNFITASKVAFYAGTNVVFIPFVLWIVYKKRPMLKAFIAAIMAFIGISIINGGGVSNFQGGDLLAIGSALSGAIYIVSVERTVKKMSSSRFAIIQLYIVGILALAVALIVSRPPDLRHLNATTIHAFIYLAFIATGLCFILQNVAQKYISSSRVSLILSLEAFFGALCGIIFLKEPLTLNIILGGGVVLLGLFICEAKIKVRDI